MLLISKCSKLMCLSVSVTFSPVKHLLASLGAYPYSGVPPETQLKWAPTLLNKISLALKHVTRTEVTKSDKNTILLHLKINCSCKYSWLNVVTTNTVDSH